MKKTYMEFAYATLIAHVVLRIKEKDTEAKAS